MSDSSNFPHDDFVTSVEQELLSLILEKLQNRTLSVTEAQDLSKEFLIHLPVEDKKHMLGLLKNLSSQHPQVLDAYVDFASSVENEDRQSKLLRMSQHIHKGEIEQAVQIAKGGE